MEWFVENEIVVFRSDLSTLAEVMRRIADTHNEVHGLRSFVSNVSHQDFGQDLFAGLPPWHHISQSWWK